MAETGFEWDPAKARTNLAKHGIAFADVTAAFEDEWAITMRDRLAAGDEQRFLIIGCDLLARARAQALPRDEAMKDIEDEYDFSRGKRGAVVPVPRGKTRITIRLDDDILEWFRRQVDDAGGGNYQTMINAVLREHVEGRRESLEKTLRRVIREEMARKQAPNAGKRQLRRPTAAWRKK